MHMADLLLILVRDGEPWKHWMFYQVLRWLATTVEHSDEWRSPSVSDDVMMMPLPMGRKRPLRVDRRFRKAVVEEAARGKAAGRTAPHVVRSLQRFCRSARTISARHGSSWVEEVLANSLLGLATAARKLNYRVLHLCTDATRFGGVDTLWTLCTLPFAGKAFWSPPVVPPSNLLHCLPCFLVAVFLALLQAAI